MIRGTLFASILGATMLVSGCGLQPGSTVVKFNHGENVARMAEATSDGMYSLYSSGDTTPKVTYNLKKGDKLGFKMGDDNKLYAVAADHTEVVDTTTMNRTLYWKMKK